MHPGYEQVGRVDLNLSRQARRDNNVGGRIPQCQMANCGEYEAYNGGALRGPFQGGGGSQPPMAAPAGVESDAVAASFFGEDHSSFDLPANGNGYFSNLIMDDRILGDFDTNNNTCPDLQSQAQQLGSAAPTARPNHKRSKNFSDQEDEVLVSAWLNISLDPVVGKDQKGGRYWSRIYEYFNEHKTCQSQRTINSLMHRWETIQKSVNKFCGCLARIELRRQSGTTMQDMVAEACALYKSEDEQRKAFHFMHCWNKLRTQPKWLAKIDDFAAGKTSNKRQKTNSNGDASGRITCEIGEGEVQAIEDNQLTRPIGKKKSKAALVQEKKKSVTASLESMWAQKKESDGEKEVKKEERFNKAFALEQERVANEKLLLEAKKEETEVKKQEVQLQKQRDEQRIMTLDLTAMPDEQKQYYMYLRSQILSRQAMPTS